MERLTRQDTLELKTRCRLTVTDLKTGKDIEVIESKNVVCTVGKAFVGGMLIDEDASHDTGLTYHAIGTSTTTPVIGDTQLGAEVKRKTITSKSRVSNEITLSTFYSAADSTYNIKEAGVFGHASATATVNTGKLMSHWLVSYDNSSGLYDLTFDWICTIG